LNIVTAVWSSLFWHRLFHQRVCLLNSAYIVNRNSLKLCVLADYHMKICVYHMVIWSDNFLRSYFSFSPRIFHRKVCTHNSYIWKFFEILPASLFTNVKIHILLQQLDWTIFWRSYCPFWFLIFHKNVYQCNSPTF
jgi:hypothetical protein